MTRLTLTAAAVLALAACSGTEPLAPAPAEPDSFPTAEAATQWTIFTSQQPNETLDASPGWEVGTKFRSSKAGKILGFRFWRAAGETGTNTAKLWTNGGSKLASASFPSTPSSGWSTVYLANPVSVSANTDYRVSVNTNTKQVKCGGCFYYDGAISNGPLYADGGYYGQPTGSMPTSSSASMFFVDVIFEENPPPAPNLYVAGILANGGTDITGQEIVTVTVCNNGNASAGSSATRVRHQWWNGSSWVLKWNGNFFTSGLAAGACTHLQIATNSPLGYNQYDAWVDVNGAVTESNEGDNYGTTTWYRGW